MTTRVGGLACPSDSGHGLLLSVTLVKGGDGWYCPHSDHNGRPPSAPSGPAPQTKAFFTLDDISNTTLIIARPPLIAKAIALTPPTDADGQRICTKCGEHYPPGGYTIHKDTLNHLRILGKVVPE